MELQLSILAKFTDFLGYFDQLEIWRSVSGEAGPFVEITAADWRGARLPESGGDQPASPVVGPFAVFSGKTLTFSFQADEGDGGIQTQSVTFIGSDPLAMADAAAQIGSTQLLSYVDSTGQLVVETASSGTGAFLELTDGSAAGDLRLPLNAPSYGKNPRLQLSKAGGENLTFIDKGAISGAFYRTRYRNRLTGAVSDFSPSFGADEVVGLTDTSLVVGKLCLVDLRGRPLGNREVRIHASFNGILVEGKLMAGQDQIFTTNDAGQLRVTLVRGQAVSIAIIGTDMVRDITVPTDPAVVEFNLFDPGLAGPDIFRVQVPDLVVAERRTL